jgi:hypothetical protein
MSQTPQNVQIIKASRALQRRVGTGEIEANAVYQAEQALKNPTIDFSPIGKGFLEHFELAILHAQDESVAAPKRIEVLTRPVMDLKANARMFGYDLVTQLTNIMLGLLEITPQINNDLLDIMRAHHRSLSIMIDRKMTGDGGQVGTQLVRELRESCGRYCTKYKLPPLHVSTI